MRLGQDMQQLAIFVISSFLFMSGVTCMEVEIKKDPGCPIALLEDNGKYLKELVNIERDGDFSPDLYTAEKTLQDFLKQNDQQKLQETYNKKILTLAQCVARRYEDYNKLHIALVKHDFHEATRVAGNNKYCVNAAYPQVLLSLIKERFLAEFLVMSGANVDQKDTLGKTPLFYDHHWADVWPCLLQYGAQVNHVDNQGNTSLYDLLAVKGMLSVPFDKKQISLLLSHGASLYVVNKYGQMGFNIIEKFNISKELFCSSLGAQKMCVLQDVPEAGKDISFGGNATDTKQVIAISDKVKRVLKEALYDAADRRDVFMLQSIIGTNVIINWRWQDKILRKIVNNHDNESLQYCLTVGFSPEGLHKSDECNLLLCALRCDNAEAIELLVQSGYRWDQILEVLEESMLKKHKECTKVLNAYFANALKEKTFEIKSNDLGRFEGMIKEMSEGMRIEKDKKQKMF
jgi:hypothetical protein